MPATVSTRVATAVTQVPDGTHTGFITSATAKTISFDKVDFLTGPAAVDAARVAGDLEPDGSVVNDYYIRNVNPLIRTLSIAPRAKLRVLANLGQPNSVHVVTPAAFAAYARQYPKFLTTLHVVGGRIVGTEPIFVP